MIVSMRHGMPDRWPATFAWMMDLAYLGPSEGEGQWKGRLDASLGQHGWDLINTFSTADDDAYIAIRNGHAVVCVRGTQMRFVDFYKSLKSLKHDGEAAVGFRKSAENLLRGGIAQTVDVLIREGCIVSAIGHSLGGAVVTAMADRMPWYSLVTCGSPRVWRPYFAGWIAKKVERVARFVNGRDLIVCVPPFKSTMGFGGMKHVSRAGWFDSKGDFRGGYGPKDELLGRLQIASREIWGDLYRLKPISGPIERYHSMSNGRHGYLELIRKNNERIISHYGWR